MFIIVHIYSKNLNSLTNFLKFFYKLQKNQALKVKFHTIQSQKKKKFYFFSTLQSPHVNKKSQEQFEYFVHGKKLKIHVSQITKFLAIWKLVKTSLFSDVKIKTEFRLQNKSFNSMLLPKINLDKFKSSKVFKSKEKRSRNLNFESKLISPTFLTLLDIRGEILLKNFFTGLDSSVGRAKDWKSLCRQFNPVSKHIKIFVMKNLLWNIPASLKNSQISRRNFIYQPKTTLTIALLNILWDEGFILGYKISNSNSNLLQIFLKYKNGNPVINSIKLVFKPSRQIYYSVSQLWKLDSKKSVVVLSTSKGLRTVYECKKNQIGGKPLFVIR